MKVENMAFGSICTFNGLTPPFSWRQKTIDHFREEKTVSKINIFSCLVQHQPYSAGTLSIFQENINFV
jgi:hypothetical protein